MKHLNLFSLSRLKATPRRRVATGTGQGAVALGLAGHCSLAVLVGLGLLAGGPAAWAQGAGGVLPVNTLPVLRGVVAGRAVINAPAPGAAVPLMTIDQSSQRAVLDWRSFNIGGAASVLFRHEQGSSASTLNRIYDASPSVIQGKLSSQGPLGADGKPTAGGQILLINQNGILFDRGSQVNTQALLASTLNLFMSNSAFCGGNLVECNSGAALNAGGLLTEAFSGGYDDAGNWLPTRPGYSRAGTIGIGSFGLASAAAPVLQSGAGGSIVLIASRIDNDKGLIASPDGQVVLAAGSKAYLAIVENDPDITLRGFKVEVEAAKDGPGLNLSNLVRNAGDITADRGNVTLAALAINQEGRISAKTAVQRNGSIFLTARTKDSADAGTLTLAKGSVTEVIPDTADTATLPEREAYAPYRGVIRAEGGLIENRGTLQAAGGRIGLEASNLADPAAARVYLADGSTTSVAGVWADVDAYKSVATIRVTSNELKNAPDQKTGILLGSTVTVDLRDGNNILSLSAARDAVPRTVAEKAAVGGELSIASTGSVIQRSQATLDVSGGGYRYGDARIATSTFLGDDGKTYDIATAPVQRQYVAQLDRYQQPATRWRPASSVVSLTGAAATLRAGYSEGQAGGTLRIGSGSGLVLDGPMAGGVTIGERQLAQAPRAATLYVGTGFAPLSLKQVDQPPVVAVYNAESQRIGNVTISQQATDTLGSGFDAATPLTAAQRDNVTLAAGQIFGAAKQGADGRVESGFGTVEVNADGRIRLPAAVSIKSDGGASLLLRGPALDIAGDIRLPGGTLTLSPVAQPLAQVEYISADLETLSERAVVRSTAQLSVAGQWANQSGTGGSPVGEALPTGRLTANGSVQSLLNGGTLALRVNDETIQTRLERGSVLDVSGGALLDSSRRITAGRGGSLTVSNGSANQTNPDWMQAELLGHALTNGGSLTLNVGTAQISPAGANGLVPAATTRLGADLFAKPGFGSVTLNASTGLDVTADTAVTVRQNNFVVDLDKALTLPSGAELRSVSDVATLADPLRSAASLTLSSGLALKLAQGSSIQADPGGNVALTATSALQVDGQVRAPGGNITLTLRGSDLLDASPLRLGSDSLLAAPAAFVPTPSDLGLLRGTVLGGGTVTLDARQAGIVTEAGSRIVVDGQERLLDVVSELDGKATLQQAVAGHAGNVILKAQKQVTLGGAVSAQGMGTAAGGSFALELTRADRQAALPAAQRLVISTDGFDRGSATGTTTSVLDTTRLQAAGFDKLRLLSEDRIDFQGNNTLKFGRGIRLDAPTLQLAADSNTTLRASTVALGQSLGTRVQDQDALGRQVWTRNDNLPQTRVTPTAGSGSLSIAAGSVDIYGSSALQGAASTRIASDGDVRFIGREVNFNTGQGNDRALVYQYGSLDLTGDLEFSATQLYPSTRTRFDLRVWGDNNYLQVKSNGQLAGDVYSAAGALSLQAPILVQSGVVRAPQGTLSLTASKSLQLAGGSTSSVSGADLSVLYGTTIDGSEWRYIDGAQTSSSAAPLVLSSVSADGKRLNLSAPAVTVDAGASVDLRGGGNVMAVEFVPGNGGDVDIATAANTYAIIPKSRLASLPYDAFLQFNRDAGSGFNLNNGRDTALYDSLQIAPGSRVAAGEYVLLPTRFALLPDAFLVQLQTGSAYRNLRNDQTSALANGEVVVAGHRSLGGTSLRESQSVGVVVLPGSAVRRYADYTISGAQLFASNAARNQLPLPAAPWDAGSMGIANANGLTLAGKFLTTGSTLDAYSGRKSEIDISGTRIAVVDQVNSSSQPPGTLQITSASLSALDASVLLGGTRQRSTLGVNITTGADQVSVANSAAAPVVLPELTITARQGIDVAAGSVLRAQGEANGGAATVLNAESTGALLRLSAGAQASVNRANSVPASGAPGVVNIAAGARLEASGSLLLDATGATQSAGVLRAGPADGTGGAISLASARVSLGQTDALAKDNSSGLILSNADLASYATLGELTLRAYDKITLLGQTQLGGSGLGRLTLDTPELAAQAVEESIPRAPNSQLQAGTVQLLNRSAVRREATGGQGQLDVNAAQVLVGAGEKATTGYATLRLNAATAIEVQGTGNLRTGGALALNTPLLRAAGGAEQRIAAQGVGANGSATYGTLSLGQAPNGAATLAPTATAAATPLGGRLTLEGGSVTVDSSVQARSGRIAVTAQDGNLTLGARAVLDAAGDSRNFSGSIAAADGGSVALTAAKGALTTDGASRIDVSAAALGGNAGQLKIQAREASLAGAVAGRAAVSAQGGSADIDLGSLASFSALNSQLDAGGFTEARQLRLRSGNLLVAAGDKVEARRVQLSTDQGRIDVLGVVGRNTAGGGGRVSLSAASGLSLGSGSRIEAAGSDVGARGGDVRVDTRGGTLAFDSGASIDARAGDAGPAGSVVFGVSRDSGNTIGASSLQGQVLRYSPSGLAAQQAGANGDAPASVDLEATRVYSGAAVPASLASSTLAGWAADHQAFVAAGNSQAAALTVGLRDETGAARGARLLGATEVQRTGDLGLDANWDLTSSAWRAGGLPGTLTVRATGDITLKQTVGALQVANLSNTTANATANSTINTNNHALVNGDTWTIRMAAGADLGAADVGATAAAAAGGAAGNLLLSGAQANIRTGTGAIELYARGDIRLDNAASAIYTGGRPGAADTATNGNNRWAVDGGNIRMSAGGSIAGPASTPDLWVTDWLRRPRQSATEFIRDGYLTDWWSFRPRFQQGVATLAGGDMDIQAGSDVKDLMFALPTSGRTIVAGGTRTVEVTGGGKLSLQAAGNVDGASVLLGRGTGTVAAGGDIGKVGALQGYLMGASSGVTPEQAQLVLAAGGQAVLQSVDNPTYMGLNGGTGVGVSGGSPAVGPSFNPTNAAATSPSSVSTNFFTYSANSGVSLLAKGGDADLYGRLAGSDNWRSITGLDARNLTLSTAFPAQLSLVSFGGDILGPGSFTANSSQPNVVKTYPSPAASLVALAQGSIRNLALEVSDLAPSALITSSNLVDRARPTVIGSDFFNTGSLVSSDGKSFTLGRITDRSSTAADMPLGLAARDATARGVYFDLQAQEGSMLADTASRLLLPGRSRILAGEDITSASLRLQNLLDADISEVRAVKGSITQTRSIEIRGPGQLLLQAGGNIDLSEAVVNANSETVGGLVATGNTLNPLLGNRSARLTVIAGVPVGVDLKLMDGIYLRLREVNRLNDDIAALYGQLELEGESGRAAVLGATNIAALAPRNKAYQRYVDLDKTAPEALAAYQAVLRKGSLPLGDGADAQAAAGLLRLIGREDDVARLAVAGGLAQFFNLATTANTGTTLGGEVLDAATLSRYTALADRFPALYRGAVLRRVNGARLSSTAPLVFDELLGTIVAGQVPVTSAGGGSIFSDQTSIQTLGGSDIDLWAPAGAVIVGRTSENSKRPVGVLTKAGGAVRSVLSRDFSINQGKVLTAQGGDILLLSLQGSIDAGRGAKTSLSTPAPQRKPVLDSQGNQIGVILEIPASALGSGIQTLTSDPDGLGPAVAPVAGDIYLFAPAGKIDAGEAGIRSSGNILLNAQVVLNASDIRASGSAQGVPQVPTTTTAAAAAKDGTSTSSNRDADGAAKAAETAARAAAAAGPPPKPTLLTVEVLGFGDKNCKEEDKNCFAK